MLLFLTKCLLYTPSTIEPVAKCRPVNSKLICPAEKRLGFATKCQLPCRWSWWGAKGFFRCPPSSKSFVKRASGHTKRCGPFGNRHRYAVKRQFLGRSWWKQKFVYAPVCIDATSERTLGNTRFFSQLANALALVANRNSPVPAGILSLLLICLPAAVTWFVVSVIIDSANRCFRKWLRSHIAQERRKRIFPSNTYAYPSPSIVHVAWIVLVVASLNHAAPSSVLWTSRMPMSCVAKNSFLSASASTRQGAFQVIRRNVPLSATRTFAQPCRFSAVVSNSSVLQYGPLPEFVPSQIFNLVWNSNKIICSHDASLISRVVRATQRVVTVGLLAFYRIGLAEPSGKWR